MWRSLMPFRKMPINDFFNSTDSDVMFADIYAVYHNEECLYVGSTVQNVWMRFFAKDGHCHRSGGKFSARSSVGNYVADALDNFLDGVYIELFSACHETTAQLRTLEAKAIQILEPKLNVMWSAYRANK